MISDSVRTFVGAFVRRRALLIIFLANSGIIPPDIINLGESKLVSFFYLSSSARATKMLLGMGSGMRYMGEEDRAGVDSCRPFLKNTKAMVT